MDDHEIIMLYLERSEMAIYETANKYSKYCKYISFNILHNNEDVEECINETYLRLWNTIPPNYPNNLLTFLGKIVRNLSLNKFKQYVAKKRGEGSIELLLSELDECIPSKNNVEKAMEEIHLVKVLNNFLFKLPKIKRVIFVRRYWYISSINEISKQYNMSESKVKSMLFRIRNQLKNYLEEEGLVYEK
jgi:RNA polymerase sigma factor (sigma-70 family)